MNVLNFFFIYHELQRYNSILENGCNDHFEPIGNKWCIRSFAYPRTHAAAAARCEIHGSTLIPVISSEMNVRKPYERYRLLFRVLKATISPDI